MHEAELLDAANPELPDLTAAAHEGLFQEERRRVLEEIEGQLSGAVTEEDVMRVASLIRDAQDKTPSDATLLRYQAQTDRRLREHESRRLVDETLKQCRATMDAAPSHST